MAITKASTLEHITQQDVRNTFSYDKRVGLLIRRFSAGRAPAGKASTYKDRDGYLCVGFMGHVHRAHRLIWLYVTGEWPKGDIDHINRIKDDNRWKNLRDVTRAENKQNQLVLKRNKCGVKGVHWDKNTSKYAAGICHNGKTYYLGQFESIHDAADAYARKAAELHKFNPCAKT